MPSLTVSRRRARALAGAVVVTAALAACGGGVTVESTSTAAVPGSATAGAPAATATIPTPAATLAGGTSTPVPPPMTGKGVPGADVADAIRSAVGSAKSVRMTLTTPAGPGTALVDLAAKSVRLTVGPDATAVTLVHIGDTTWVRGAGTVTAAPTASGTATPPATTRRWLQLRPDGQDALSRRLGASVNVEGMLRPAAFADLFDGLLGDETPIDGGRRVSFWVPPEKYVEVVRGNAALAAALTQPVVVVVELDDENRPKRLTATMVSAKTTVVDDTTYSDWDGGVSITPPPSAEVGPAPAPGQGDSAPDGAGPSATATGGSSGSGGTTRTVTVTATPAP